MKPTRWQSFFCIILVAALAFAFGWPTRHGDFLGGDDHHFVIEHVFVNHPSWRNAWNLLTMVHSDLYQPLPMLTLQADYACAGTDPTGRFPISPLVFHLTNIALHSINAVLAFFIAARIAGCLRVGLLAGLLFACHPFAMESVAWITGRMILLTATFSLVLILLCLVRHPEREGRWAVAASATWLAAVFSKVLPTVPIAAAWCDYQYRRRLSRRAWLVYAFLTLIGLAVMALAVKSTYEIGFFERIGVEATTSVPVRVLLASRYYFENYVWPTRLCPWSPPPDHVPFLSPSAAIGLAEWSLFGVMLLDSRRRCRVAFIGLVLFVFLIAPFLAATAARTFLTADRYMYLPMLGLHLVAAALLVQAFDAIRKKWATPPATLLMGTTTLLILAALLRISWRQASHWTDMIAQARHTLELFPDSADAYAELARSFANAGQFDAALRVVEDARGHWPGHPRLAARAGDIYRRRQDWPNAVRELSAAAGQMPDHVPTLFALGRSLEELGRVSEARDYYERVLRVHPGDLPAVIALASSYEKAGDFGAAIAFRRRAAEIDPYHRDNLLSLAVLLMKRQEWSEADRCLRSILKLDPNDAAALLNLGVVEARSGHTDEAQALYDRLIAMDAGNVTARLNRAALWLSQGRRAEATSEFRAVLAKDSDNRSAMIGLHEALQSAGNFPALVDLWRGYKGRSIPPPERSAWLAWSLALRGDRRDVEGIVTKVPADSEARAFSNWAAAYSAFSSNDSQRLIHALGPPMPPNAPSPQRLEWLRVVQTALEALPAAKRDAPTGLYLLARLALENGNAALAEQAARQCARSATDAELRHAAASILDVISETRKSAPPPPNSK